MKHSLPHPRLAGCCFSFHLLLRQVGAGVLVLLDQRIGALLASGLLAPVRAITTFVTDVRSAWSTFSFA
jgi:hypothetical protein